MTARLRHRTLRMVILSLFIFHLSSFISFAQSYLGASVAGTVPLLTDNIAATHTKPSFGGEIGAVYEWHSGHLFVRTGVNYALVGPVIAVEDRDIEQPMIDTRGVPFIYRGQLTGRTDRLIAGQLGLPLYIGGVWKGWYGMAGVQLNISLHANASIKASLSTLGDYQGRYYDPLERMPNHGYYEDKPVASSSAFAFRRIDVRLGAETGYTFVLPSRQPGTTAVPPLLRLGVFAEYGLLNACSDRLGKDAPSSIEPDYSHYMSITMNPLYASSDAANSAAHWLTFGIRLTFLYPLPGSSARHPCNCYGTYR